MKKFIIFLSLNILALSYENASAQLIAFDNPEADLQRARIGLVDEFMKRFNGDEAHPDLASLNRNLIGLFDYEQFMHNNQTVQDSIRAEAMNLIEIVKSDSIKINYSDTSWAAIAHCRGMVMGKPEKFDIYLTVQSRGEDMYKWVINTVEGECFNIAKNDANDNIIISPDAHETKFIALKRITKEQPHNIQLFLPKNLDYSPTSVFAFLVYSGKLTIDYVERLEFIFLQVPEYAFHVQYFDRQSSNSGWLISNFYRFSDSDKAAFRRMINQEGTGLCTGPEDSKSLPIDSITHSDSTAIPINSLLEKRIIERLKSLKDYIGFISESSNDQSTKNFYAKKLVKLFSQDAKAIIKNFRTGKINAISIKNFADGVVANNYKNMAIDAVTSAILQKSDSCSGDINVLATGIIPLTVIESDEILQTIFDKILPYHLEDTEDGVEYIFDFGDLYITEN